MNLLGRVQSPRDVRSLPEEMLPRLCDELREEIISICGKVGGHLGASLGAVELIVALHRTFHAPEDDLVFDVGHQAYAHKLLTGRRERMHTLRQEGGVAPFLDPRESPLDAFGAGHACTAISVALGMAEARAASGAPGRAVAIVGDGALTGGLSFEALNHAGDQSLPLVVVVNDNGMSISANVGAVPRLLGSPVRARAFFESMGFTYLGLIDGHRLEALLPALAEARRSRRPVVVHVRTEKGRGLAEAETDTRTRGHAMGPFELRDGKLVRSRGGHVQPPGRLERLQPERAEGDEATPGALGSVQPARTLHRRRRPRESFGDGGQRAPGEAECGGSSAESAVSRIGCRSSPTTGA